MRALLRAELVRIATTRTALGLVASGARVRVVAAKTILVAAVAQVVMLAVAIVLLQGRGVEPTLETADLAAMGGLTAASALWATIGVAVDALPWVLLVENLGAGAPGEAARYLPGQAGHGVVA
jgi:hypothetical protein